MVSLTPISDALEIQVVKIRALENAKASPTESPFGSTVSAPGTALINSSGQSYTLVGTVGAYQIAVNGVTDATSSRVVLLLAYTNASVHVIYQENADGNWWYQPNSTTAWTGPVVDPRPTESLQGATVSAPGTALFNSTLQAYTLVGSPGAYQVAVNGVIDATTSNVILLLYYTASGVHVMYQENAAGQFYYQPNSTTAYIGPLPDPRGSTGITAPAQATGTDQHGNRFQYTTLVFDSEFNSASDVSASTSGTVPAPWYQNSVAFDGGTVAAYTISGGKLTITVDNSSHGGGFASIMDDNACATSAAPTTTVAGKPAYGYAFSAITPPVANGNGIAFRYFYAECSAAFDFARGASTGSYYPTFWMYPTRPTQFVSGFMELDVLELYPHVGSNAFGDIIVHSGSNDGATPSSMIGANGPAQVPQSVLNKSNPNAFNAYGVLWTPTFIQLWYNNVGAAVIPMDAAIPYNNGQSIVGNTAMNMSSLWLVLIIGTGPSWPVTYDYVRVWQ